MQGEGAEISFTIHRAQARDIYKRNSSILFDV
jgi:hypothetical protein